MQRLTKPFVVLCLSANLLISHAATASVIEKAQQWLNSYSGDDNPFSLTFTKNKIQFKGCKQKQYQLSFSQQVSPYFNLEAVVHYNKGRLDYGVLSHRVRSHEFEVVSWWDTGDYRVGLSHKIRPQHEMRVPVAGAIRLPTSTTAGLYVEVPFNEDSHILTIGALQEAWDVDSASATLPWRASTDNKLTLQYAVSF